MSHCCECSLVPRPSIRALKKSCKKKSPITFFYGWVEGLGTRLLCSSLCNYTMQFTHFLSACPLLWSLLPFLLGSGSCKPVRSRVHVNQDSLPFPRILPLDLCDPGSVESVAEKAQAVFGRVDILINNAGEFLSSRVHFIVQLMPTFGC